ncbi:dihydropteroate synthase [Fusarium heterosporum]|uniref:Dihydropteroate synthase n=1 Tax=Fusarium heterosporum TaxID=42747 RepID=A0A8H5TRV6_FUSHE|nr:dihydropteroate synthase [Fusarium heterosporum]
MSDGKRKQGPGGNGPASKKSKGGSAGKWQTTHQKVKQNEQMELGRTLEVNDEGIWVTYARGMKGKAIREFKSLCHEYGESLFGVKPPKEDGEDEDDENAGDIEASIEKELASLTQPKPRTRQTFTPIGTGLDCVFFMKTVKPIEPLTFVTKVCQDAKDCPDPMQRKTKYINRLTPIFDTDKATDKGIERVARTVMGQHFELKSESGEDAVTKEEGEGPTPCTYAIRYNIRNHTAFKSSEVIKKIADLVKPKHKVNLTNPDKVVLVEIFQLTSAKTFCGVSVVDGKESEELKRYNLNELYKVALEEKKSKPVAEGAAESKST